MYVYLFVIYTPYRGRKRYLSHINNIFTYTFAIFAEKANFLMAIEIETELFDIFVTFVDFCST